jgi:acetyl-CoA acetyltransferase
MQRDRMCRCQPARRPKISLNRLCGQPGRRGSRYARSIKAGEAQLIIAGVESYDARAFSVDGPG